MKIKPKQIGFLLLCVLIGSLLMSITFIMDASGEKNSLGFIQWGYAIPPIVVVLILFMIGVGCGALVIYLTKISNSRYVFFTSLFTGIITLFFYAIITLLVNWEYIFSPKMQHYAWSGAMGYIGDALLILLVVPFAYGLYILPGFLVGGFLIKKIKTSKENQI